MKANSLDHTNTVPGKEKPPDTACSALEVTLDVEELEDVIVPLIVANHNETMLEHSEEVYLEVEDMEEVIAPKLAGIEGANHNETLVSHEVGLNAEELEEILTPTSLRPIPNNHNETLVSDDHVHLSTEELEEVIAPVIATNHNEALLTNEIAFSPSRSSKRP
jgi:hypothetical protein